MSFFNLADKYEENDGDESKQEFTCTLCYKTELQSSYEHFLKRHVCKSKQNKSHHVSSQNKGHVCELCHKSFPQHSRLVRHQAMHATARPFACVKCHKSFKTDDSLNIHLKLFKDGECAEIPVEKPYACDICGARYQTQRSLRRHNVDTHLSEGDVKERVQRRSNDVTKDDSDDGDAGPANPKQYTCEKCGITYQTSRSLTRHILNRHSGM